MVAGLRPLTSLLWRNSDASPNSDARSQIDTVKFSAEQQQPASAAVISSPLWSSSSGNLPCHAPLFLYRRHSSDVITSTKKLTNGLWRCSWSWKVIKKSLNVTTFQVDQLCSSEFKLWRIQHRSLRQNRSTVQTLVGINAQLSLETHKSASGQGFQIHCPFCPRPEERVAGGSSGMNLRF